MKEVAYVGMVMILMMNTMLWAGGYFSDDSELISLYPFIGDTSLLDDSTTVQDNLTLQTQTSQPVADNPFTQFLVNTLQFIQSIPYVGSLLGVFGLLVNLLAFSTLGFTNVMLRIGVPGVIVNVLAVLVYAIFTLGFFELVKEFVWARGSK